MNEGVSVQLKIEREMKGDDNRAVVYESLLQGM